jgi:hypothetical protein
VRRAAQFVLGFVVLLVSTAGRLSASVTPTVPEIDGNSALTGLGLLTAGVLIVRARWRSK